MFFVFIIFQVKLFFLTKIENIVTTFCLLIVCQNIVYQSFCLNTNTSLLTFDFRCFDSYQNAKEFDPNASIASIAPISPRRDLDSDFSLLG